VAECPRVSARPGYKVPSRVKERKKKGASAAGRVSGVSNRLACDRENEGECEGESEGERDGEREGEREGESEGESERVVGLDLKSSGPLLASPLRSPA
jgi:hypothetical protein